MSAQGYDAVVIGGGPAGCAAALTLVRGGASVALIEQTQYEDLRWGETLSPSVRAPLQTLGVWQRFTRANHLPSLGVVSYWGSSEVAYRDYAFHPFRTGWHVDRRRFDAMLADECAGSGVHLQHARAVATHRDSARWHVVTTSDLLHARLLVNAAGRHASFFMPEAGPRWFSDYAVALVQAFELETPRCAWTLIESSANGWAYSAPLPGNYRIVMFVTEPEVVRSMSMPDLLAAATHTRHALRNAVACHAPLVRNASIWCRARLVGHMWLCIGEAATTLDPLSGRGLVRALTDGIAAGRVALAMLAGDDDLAERFQLRIRRRFAADAVTARGYYRAERRWADSSFWRRRQKDGAAAQP
jgi:flavin-dependent dehydrogenase